MRRIYGDALMYYLISLGEYYSITSGRGVRQTDHILDSHINVWHHHMVRFRWTHPGIVLHVNSVPTKIDIAIHLRSSRLSRILISIVSCRIILNIRKYGNGYQAFDTNVQGATDMGEIVGPISRLHFEHTRRSSGLRTELGLS